VALARICAIVLRIVRERLIRTFLRAAAGALDVNASESVPRKASHTPPVQVRLKEVGTYW
jgi:hypothetical protein